MPIPSPSDFLLKTALYSKSHYKESEIWDVLNILYFDGTYDSFCTECGRDSTFQVIGPKRPDEHVRNIRREEMMKSQGFDLDYPGIPSGVYQVHSYCTRVKAHQQYYILFVEHQWPNRGTTTAHGVIEKIGQKPSYSDLHMAEVKKYRPVVTKEQLAEFTRAIGLASHDVGVGAYVYLRRIFESLVEEAHQSSRSDPGWDETAYLRLRMNERISALKEHLPNFLVEHSNMYSLLSKGIHELSEEDCLKHFDTLRLGIELILDERLQQRERASKIAAAKAAISKAVNN